MKRLLCLVSVAALYGAATLAAQSGPPPSDQGKKPDHTVTLTGCVAAGASAGHYTLTHATHAPAVAKDAAGAKDKMAADHAMSYMLVGGGDWKPHVGHKVEVVGTVAKPDPAKDTMAKTEKDKMPMMGGTVTVTSFKMVSATCP